MSDRTAKLYVSQSTSADFHIFEVKNKLHAKKKGGRGGRRQKEGEIGHRKEGN
jgi:hypothetical protein